MAANQNSTIKTTVILDATQAQQEIVKLNTIASDGNVELEKRIEAKNKQVNIQNTLSEKTIKNIEKEIKDLKKLGNSEKDIIKLEKKLSSERIKATKVSENGAKAQKKLNKALDDSKSSTVAFDKASGGLLTKFASLKKGVIILAGSFRTLGGAIAATGLGLLILVIASVVAAFKGSEEGQNKFAKIMGVIGVLVGNLVDLLADLGEFIISVFENPGDAITKFGELLKDNIITRFEGMMELIPAIGKAIKLLFSGKFKEAGKVAADAVGKVVLGMDSVTDSIGNAIDKMGEFIEIQKTEADQAIAVANMRAQADKLDRKLVVERAKKESEINKLKLQARLEEEFSTAQRIEFLKEAQLIEDALLAQEVESLELRAKAIALENTFSRSNKENLDAQAEAEAKVFRIQAARIKNQEATQRKLNTLLDEQKAEDAKADKEEEAKKKKIKDDEALEIQKKKDAQALEVETQLQIDELELERLRTNGDNVLAIELAILQRRMEQELMIEGLTASQILLIRKKFEDASTKITKISEDSQTKQKEVAKDQAIGFLGESFGISQEVAIAQMIMAAPQAVGQSFKKATEAYAPPLSGIMGALGAATALVPIIRGLADIKKTRFPGKKKGAPASSGGTINTGALISSQAQNSAIDDIAANNAARLGIDPNIGQNATSIAANNVIGGAQQNIIFSENSFDDFTAQIEFREEAITIG
ncbi:MAG: hypothetical protein QQN55_03655 [Nitrosopumilus sp.]